MLLLSSTVVASPTRNRPQHTAACIAFWLTVLLRWGVDSRLSKDRFRAKSSTASCSCRDGGHRSCRARVPHQFGALRGRGAQQALLASMQPRHLHAAAQRGVVLATVLLALPQRACTACFLACRQWHAVPPCHTCTCMTSFDTQMFS